MRLALVSSLSFLVAATAAAADNTAIAPTDGGRAPGEPGGSDLHSWELPALTVQGRQAGSLHEEDRVGDYGQPRWTATRRFVETRVYVIPKGQFEFEYWLFIDQPSRKDLDDAKNSGSARPKSQVKQQYEAEMGLGYRLQVDIYQVYLKDGANGNNALDSTKFEVRYALADWDKIWGNPTFYGEWTQAASGADLMEYKLLLGGELAPRWHWGTNFVYEAELGNAREHSHEWNSGLSYTIEDGMFSVGAEDKIAYITEHPADATGGFDPDTKIHHWEFMVGPSIQVRTIPRMHLDFDFFVGLNDRAPESETAAILGWEF
jgi:hypothetical protein